MTSAFVAEQIVVEAPNRVGLLADVTTALLGAGVNVTAIMGWEGDGRAKIVAVTEDNEQAVAALTRAGISPTTEPVVVMTMPDEVGALNEAAQRISQDGIDIVWMYATVAEATHVTVIFKTTDNEAVAALF